jgi:gliding motility-associated lipoprotein GldH
MRTAKLILCIAYIAASVLMTSCRRNVVYSHFIPMKSEKTGEWHMDSAVCFDYSITDAQQAYSLIVYVRHTERYPYQNMWLFIGDSIQRDTIEFYLADDRGRWLGDRHHGFIEMPVLIEENLHFPDTGSYCMEVRHAMRDTLLRGITDVGLEVTIDK